MPRTYILLECIGPDTATEAEAVGHITGVLAQHGALGEHHTARGTVTVSLLAGCEESSLAGMSRHVGLAKELIVALRGLAFDVNRTAHPFGSELGVSHDHEAQR